MNLYKNSNLKSCDIKYNPKLEPNLKSNKRTSFLLSNSKMSLNSSDKKLRSNSSNSKSKSSSGKKLSQSVQTEFKDIKDSKFKSCNNNLKIRVADTDFNKNLKDTNNVTNISVSYTSKSPNNRLKPKFSQSINSAKSNKSCKSNKSNNSRMSPIDINELGSDEKDSMIDEKYKNILGSICSPNNFSLADQNDVLKKS